MRDVQRAFLRLAVNDERIAINRGELSGRIYNSGGPHVQGIQRLSNTNMIIMSGSSSGAQLMTGWLRSRPTRGRFRSNVIDSGRPPGVDAITSIISPNRLLAHAGGFQASGRYIAIGFEAYNPHRSEVRVLDLGNPARPRTLRTIDRPTVTAGAVALSRDGDGFLLIAGGFNSSQLDFYRAARRRDGSPGRFDFVATWSASELRDEPDRQFGSYQNINLLRQDDGALFLVGLYRSSSDRDLAELFSLRFDRRSGRPRVRKLLSSHLTADGRVDFNDGAGIYVDGEDLIVYGVAGSQAHGHFEISEFRSVPTRLVRPLTNVSNGWVEFYVHDTFRGQSVLIDHRDRFGRDYSNFANLGEIGRFDDEFSSVKWLLPATHQFLAFEHHDFKGALLRLQGNGQPRSHRNLGSLGFGDRISSGRFGRTTITSTRQGWIELFEHHGFTGRRLTVSGTGRASAIRDYGRVVAEGRRGFGDKVSSVRWQLPTGLRYRLYEHDSFRGRSVELQSTGRIREISNLQNLGFGDTISSSRYD